MSSRSRVSVQADVENVKTRAVLPRVLPYASLALLAMSFLFFLWMARRQDLPNGGYWAIAAGQDVLSHRRLTGNPDWLFPSGENGTWVTVQAVGNVVSALLWRIFGLNTMLAVWFIAGLGFLSLAHIAFKKISPSHSLIAHRISVESLLASGVLVTTALTGFPMHPISFILLPFLSVMIYRFLITGAAPRPLFIFFYVLLWGLFDALAFSVGILLVLVLAARTVYMLSLKKQLPSFLGNGRNPILSVIAALVATVVTGGSAVFMQQISIPSFISLPGEPDVPFSSPSVLLFAVLIFVWGYACSLLICRKDGLEERIVWGKPVNGFLPLWIVILEGSFLTVVFLLSSASSFLFPISIFIILPVVFRRVLQILPQNASLKPVDQVRRGRVVLVSASAFIIAFAILAVSSVMPLTHNVPQKTVLIPSGILGRMHDLDRGKRIILSYSDAGKTLVLAGDDTSLSVPYLSDSMTWDTMSTYRRMLLGGPTWKKTFTSFPSPTDAVLPSDSPLLDRLQSLNWTECLTLDKYTWLTAPDASCGVK